MTVVCAKNRYSIKLEECPLLECAICGQGVHEECWFNLLSGVSAIPDYVRNKINVIRKYVNPFKLPGIFYIFPTCEERTIPKVQAPKNTSSVPNPLHDQAQETDEMIDVEAIADTQEYLPTNDDSATTVTEIVGELTTNVFQNHDQVEVTTNDFQNHDQAEGAATTEEEMNDVEATSGTQDSLAPAEKVIPPKKSTEVCRYFHRGTCKHGLRGTECRYSHPKMCRKFVQHGTRQPTGCNLGQRCKFFHPLMCLDSLRNSECYNENIPSCNRDKAAA